MGMDMTDMGMNVHMHMTNMCRGIKRAPNFRSYRIVEISWKFPEESLNFPKSHGRVE